MKPAKEKGIREVLGFLSEGNKSFIKDGLALFFPQYTTLRFGPETLEFNLMRWGD